jgi:2-polyprenyl-6-methoxyphenol hydroxylase-like FAD-dependent oxidoreductase
MCAEYTHIEAAMKTQASTQVLICGAGAAGLTLAIDLARRGVSLRLIDKLPAPFAGSRGKGIQPRTLEVFEDLGVVDRLAAVGGPYPTQRLHKADGTTVDTQEIAVAPPTAEEPYRAPLMVPQFRTEAVLRERLAELGGAPEYGRELTGFDQDADGVTATVAGPDGVETIRCRYLVGGDGGRSFVRRALDIGFPGKTLGVRAVVADIELDGLSRDAWHRSGEGDMDRQIGLCPLPHTDLFQLQAPIPPENEKGEGEVDLSSAGLQAFVDSRWPAGGLTVGKVAWASAYGMNARLADRYRVGRVLLIGDAAHIHPPTGGQGLNTSVQDAYNLGWKLAAVLAGAPGTLLDTYEEERRPIAAGMLGLATGLLDKAKQGDMKRGREVHQLDLGYRFSSLALEADRSEHLLQPGDRAPDGLLRGAAGHSVRLFDLLAGPHWTLLARGVDPVALPSPRPGLRAHAIGLDGELHDPDDALAAAYGLADGELALIRPDGYVAAIVAAAEGARLEAYLAGAGLSPVRAAPARAA